MKYLVVSYSHTGNNALLARMLAEKTGSDYTEIQEVKKRRIFTIVLDVIFKRIPKILPLQKEIGRYDYIIFVAPIWFGKIATPLRQLFVENKDNLNKFAFVSISAGTSGIVPSVESELNEYLNRRPSTLVHHLISDLVPYDQRSNHKLLNAYRISAKDAEALTDNTYVAIQNSII